MGNSKGEQIDVGVRGLRGSVENGEYLGMKCQECGGGAGLSERCRFRGWGLGARLRSVNLR